MTNKKVIVIGQDHYNTLWLVRSLGMVGIRPYLIIHSSNSRSFVSKSKYCKDFVILKEKEEILQFLTSRTNEEKAVLFTSSDMFAEFLDKNYNILSKKYIIQNCNGKQGNLSYWMDKNHMILKAMDCGLITPISYSLSTSIKSDLSLIKFPCLVKPELSAEASKDNFRLCYNIQDLNTAIQEVKKNCSKVLVQEYIKAEYEYLIYGVSTDAEICIPGGLRKIHTCTSSNNLGMMSYSCLSNEIPSQIGSFDKIKKFIKSIGYIGLFSIEFMITKDKAYFLEINLRNDGTCYITTQAEVNMPALWAYSSLGKDSSNLSRTFKRPYTYGMNEINYLKYTFNFKNFIRCLKEIFSVRAFSLIKINDMKPVVYKLLISGIYIPITNYVRNLGGGLCNSTLYNLQYDGLIERGCAA